MWLGVGFGISACILWGLSYLIPVLLPDYSAWIISLGRTIVTGLTAMAVLFFQREYLRRVSFKDWKFAFLLSFFGTLIQPWFLFTSVQYAGVALAATFFGLVPVTVAVIANERDKRRGKKYLAVSRLIVPLSVILCGLLLSNWDGLIGSLSSDRSLGDFVVGCLYATASTALWTWYPIRNAEWLQDHRDVSSAFFSTMQSLVILPVAFLLFIAEWIRGGGAFLGPRPLDYAFWMLIVGLFCSYIAAVLWNAMSQRVPTAIVGPMLVFETFFSVTFSLIYEKSWPSVTLICGMALLMGGVVYTLRMFEKLVQNDAGGSA